MEFREVLRQRRMVRSYSGQPVAREVIERILEAGRRAPSAGFSQGVRMAVVTQPETRRTIADLADEAAYVAQGFEPWIGAAPVLVALGVSEDDYHARYREPDKLGPDGEIAWPVPYWWVDGGAALMAMLLATVDEGLVAGFLGVHAVQEVTSIVGFTDDVSFLGLVTIGYPGPTAARVVGSAQRDRRPETAQVRWIE